MSGVAAPAAVYVRGDRLPLGPVLGNTAGASRSAVVGDPARAVTVEWEPTAGREALVRAMVDSPPMDPRAGMNPPALAWPDAVALDDAGRFVGFVATRVDGTVAFPGETPPWPWPDRCALAADVASALAALHAGGWAVGAIAPDDLRVTAPALVTVVGWGSVQAHRGRDEAIAADCRELARLALRLLGGAGEEARCLLPPPLRRLGDAAAGDAPPAASEWRDALADAVRWVVPCPDRSDHAYPAHLATCPWCEQPERPIGPTGPARSEATPLDAGSPRHARHRGRRRRAVAAAAVGIAAVAAVAAVPGGSGRDPVPAQAGSDPAAGLEAPPPTRAVTLSGAELFAEDFTAEQGFWAGSYGPVATAVDGRLHIALPARYGRELPLPLPAPPRGSVRLEADVEATGGARFALACRQRHMAYAYRAELDQRGWWLVVEMVLEPNVTNVPLRQASNPDQYARAVRLGGPNRVALECDGGDEPGQPFTMRLLVNGQLVTEVTIPSGLGPGGVAIAAQGQDGPGEVWFDNVTVTQM